VVEIQKKIQKNDRRYGSMHIKKCCFQLYKYCTNVPIHVYGAAVGENDFFHSRFMGKKVFTNIV
jgi:ribosomal protein L21E